MRWQQARNAARHANRELGAQVLKEELRAQDPWQRISFLPHLVNYRSALSHFGRLVQPDRTDPTPQLVPFWTIIALCHVKRGRKHAELGWAEGAAPRVSYMDIGCSIAAVPSQHWASGLLLDDDLRSMSKLRNVEMEMDLPSRVSDAPAFAYSFPQLDDEEKKVISTIPESRDGEWINTWQMMKSPHIYAVPTYRVAYKIQLEGGRIGYVDGCYDRPSHRVVLQRRRGTYLSNYAWSAYQSLHFYARKLFGMFHTTDVSREPLLPAGKSGYIAEMLLEVMQRCPINWNHSSIIPFTGSGRSGKDLVQQADLRILGRSRAVQVFSPNTPTRDSPKENAPKPTPRPPPPRPPKSKPRPILEPILAPAPVRIRDHRGYYSLLGITPTLDLLDPRKSDEMAIMLRDRRRDLARVHHSDVGGRDRTMSQINIAYDHLRTLELRKIYSE